MVAVGVLWEHAKFIEEIGVPRSPNDQHVSGLTLGSKWHSSANLCVTGEDDTTFRFCGPCAYRSEVAIHRELTQLENELVGSFLPCPGPFLLDVDRHRSAVLVGVTLGSLFDDPVAF